MRQNWRTIRGWFAVVAMIAVFGCGGGGTTPPASSSTTEAEVSGKVTLSGKPITQGEVNFNPANINRPNATTVSAKIKDDGTYVIKTLVGQNTIMLKGPTVTGNQKLEYFSKVFDVQPGSNTVNLEIE